MYSTRHLLLVPLLLSCALGSPQFAYTTSTYHNPYVPLPLARAPVYDVYNNQIDPSALEDAPVPDSRPPSPYDYIPATLPLAIYSEPAHILSGYSYQTLDPAGAKSQVLFVSGPNSQQLFRQNANLLNIVLPSLFTEYGNAVIPRAYPEWRNEAEIPEQADTSAANDESATESKAESDLKVDEPTSEPSADPASSTESEEASSTTGTSESTIENASPEPKSEEDTSLEDSKPTAISTVPEDDTSKEESDKSSETEDSTNIPAVKGDDVKIDVSTSEASNSVKTVPLEGDSSEGASTEIPSISENTSENVNSGEEKASDSKDGQTTASTVVVTTIAPAE